MTRKIRLLAVTLAAMALVGAACGSDDSSGDDDSGSTASGVIESVDDAKGAVVQITAEGEFRDPEVGTVSGGGTGSGFIVDPSGIVVTNNHVVTGAGSLKVTVAGDDEEIPAEVLGVSECDDLAVIKLDDEGPWPYLEIADTAPEPTMDVYALGFPLGDPEYTATKGVVSKAEANGESNWASVSSVIEHDANIQPGNSGGPLINEDAQVVGVNYASFANDATTTQQFYAINSELATDVVDELKEGDQLSIGVNGTAVADEESGLAGVWVNAVDAGGLAKSTGVAPGDIITNLNGVQLDSGTFEEYCDVLRSASEGDVLSIRVLRFDTSEELEGEINGAELATTFSFATELSDDVGESTGEAVSADQYVEVFDDEARIGTRVPGEWEVDGAPFDVFGLGTPQPRLIAAPSIDGFVNNSQAGALIVAVDNFAPTAENFELAISDVVSGSGCTEASRDNYEDSILAGPLVILDCGGGVAGVVLAASTTESADTIVVFAGQAGNEAELAVLDEMITALVVS